MQAPSLSCLDAAMLSGEKRAREEEEGGVDSPISSDARGESEWMTLVFSYDKTRGDAGSAYLIDVSEAPDKMKENMEKRETTSFEMVSFEDLSGLLHEDDGDYDDVREEIMIFLNAETDEHTKVAIEGDEEKMKEEMKGKFTYFISVADFQDYS